MGIVFQHIPAFVDHFDDPAPQATYNTLEELLAVDFVARWMKPDGVKDKFYCRSGNCLMIEGMEKGGHRWWWVIAYVNEILSIMELPEWTGPKCPTCGGSVWSGGGLPKYVHKCDLCNLEFEV